MLDLSTFKMCYACSNMIMQAMCTPVAAMYPCWICILSAAKLTHPLFKADSPSLRS